MQKAYEFDFVYDTQAAFRLLLEALSNPGRIVELGPLARKLGGAYAMPLTVAAVLLDNEVSFAVCGSPALAEKITELTLAKTAAVSKADYIFVTENADWQEAVQAAKCGTLRDPHKSATVILCTADLQAGKLQRISGPGIKAVQEIIMCPELQAALGKRDEQEYEYPLGLDFFVLDQRGCLMVSGGQEAIEESIRLLHCLRGSTFKELEVEAIEKKLGLLVDRVMSESGLYAPAYAALALKQAEGSIEEAVFLLRAYRSTLSRNYYTLPASGTEMRAVRRISAAFKDIQGGQILGATYDYTHRLIEFKQPSAVELCARRQCCLKEAKPVPVVKLPRVSEYLKAEGLIDSCEIDDMEPVDVTKNVLEFPADRSARLQTLTRADGGFIGGLAYSSIRGYGAVHPTVELEVPYLFDETESICIGEILLTEVEGFIPEDDDKKLKLAVGYGAVLGRNENKAISMAVLDASLETEGPAPAQDEEFVLLHGDSLEMNGFISHLKLPHYVTFQSKLDSVRKTRKEPEHES